MQTNKISNHSDRMMKTQRSSIFPVVEKGKLEAYFRKIERKKNHTCICLINLMQKHHQDQAHYHFAVTAKVQMLIYLT